MIIFQEQQKNLIKQVEQDTIQKILSMKNGQSIGTFSYSDGSISNITLKETVYTPIDQITIRSLAEFFDCLLNNFKEKNKIIGSKIAMSTPDYSFKGEITPNFNIVTQNLIDGKKRRTFNKAYGIQNVSKDLIQIARVDYHAPDGSEIFGNTGISDQEFDIMFSSAIAVPYELILEEDSYQELEQLLQYSPFKRAQFKDIRPENAQSDLDHKIIEEMNNKKWIEVASNTLSFRYNLQKYQVEKNDGIHDSLRFFPDNDTKVVKLEFSYLPPVDSNFLIKITRLPLLRFLENRNTANYHAHIKELDILSYTKKGVNTKYLLDELLELSAGAQGSLLMQKNNCDKSHNPVEAVDDLLIQEKNCDKNYNLLEEYVSGIDFTEEMIKNRQQNASFEIYCKSIIDNLKKFNESELMYLQEKNILNQFFYIPGNERITASSILQNQQRGTLDNYIREKASEYYAYRTKSYNQNKEFYIKQAIERLKTQGINLDEEQIEGLKKTEEIYWNNLQQNWK